MGTVSDGSRGSGPPVHRRPAVPAAEAVLGELSHVLWQLRDLTTNLVYRLEVQQLLMVSGRARWIGASTEDVDRAIGLIQRKELDRVRLVERLSPMLDTAPDATLEQLCEVAPPPWDLVLSEHRAEFLLLTAEAEDAARDNRELLHQGLAELRQMLQAMGGPAAVEEGYGDLGGRIRRSGPSAVLIDRDA
jgi:hypothetical protein